MAEGHVSAAGQWGTRVKREKVGERGEVECYCGNKNCFPFYPRGERELVL